MQLGGPPAGREVQLDAVFDAAAPTAAVYEAAARPLLPHLLAGFNVTVLAYGQTGSGKTHTMRGGDGDEAGLIPLAVGEVFRLVAACPGRDFQLRLSYLEVSPSAAAPQAAAPNSRVCVLPTHVAHGCSGAAAAALAAGVGHRSALPPV